MSNSKQTMYRSVVIIILLVSAAVVWAQPGGGGGEGQGNPPVAAPIDSGVIGMVLGAASYAYYLAKQKLKNVKE